MIRSSIRDFITKRILFLYKVSQLIETISAQSDNRTPYAYSNVKKCAVESSGQAITAQFVKCSRHGPILENRQSAAVDRGIP